MKLIKIIIPCLLLNACFFGTSKTAKFYTQSATATSAVSADYISFIGVTRVQMPKYVDRPQIVTQQKKSVQINISEYNRWIEFPSILATRVITEDLGVLLPAAKVKMNQSKGEGFDWIVSVEITKMNAVLGENAELVAWYTIKDHSKKVLTQQQFSKTVQIGQTYDDLSNGYSQLLVALSEEIARVLVKK